MIHEHPAGRCGLIPGVWKYDGSERPPWADEPGSGEESVWDYPRPPRLAADDRHVVVRAAGVVIADSIGAIRVLETASPPAFYLPPHDVDLTRLVPASGSSLCEWKGPATYWSIEVGDTTLDRAAWSYENPSAGYEQIAGHLSFYPARLACTVDGVRVEPQPGGFYGGWVTPEVVGPFKGEGDTGWW